MSMFLLAVQQNLEDSFIWASFSSTGISTESTAV
jgi:hypothetical protein